MAKQVTLKIVNASTSEAFEFEGIKIKRSFNEELALPMEKANRLVAALGNIHDITITVVPDTLANAPQGYGQAELADAKQLAQALEAEVVSLTAKVNDQQSVMESQAKKITELEALIEAQKQPVQETVEVKTTEAVEPAKTATKKAAK